ncbi:type II toxin-antitoxin system HicB family antitoxin [Dyadobacter sp. CY312]|uniref:type II toxin-antitoxin system HicB family antitoxin n=1 Tax=Dyadobacter sp. CY312 TaxID=2907303 RepID=UPI001F19405F|nr:type II toxin-antitoxin system HicB family antitoxin [Dyadobacter sp. CY312]MCE7043369.1 type II toxin-antitoxin system HicB family antitoxin [Dyadobacter sp. CY312]
MKTLKVIIEKSKDSYSAYSENFPQINGMGDSLQEVKESVLNSIEIIKGFDARQIPSILKTEYQIEWKLDVASLLNYYKPVFNQSGLAKVAGINEKLLNHYATGEKKPGAAQVKKIEVALHQLGKELLAVEL